MSRNNRTRRRKQRKTTAANKQIAKMVQPTHNLKPYEMVDDEGIELLHDKSMEILSDVGIDFYDDEAQAVLKAHGVKMVGDTAFFDSATIAKYIAKAPHKFTQLARNPDNNLTIGGKNLCFAPVYGPPFVLSQDYGRREAKLTDFVNFIKLTNSTPYLHHQGGTICEPTDLPVHTRHLDMIYSHIKYGDKAFMGAVTSAGNAADSVAMAEIMLGKQIYDNPALLSLINVSSPRRYDDRMLGAMKVYAKARQAVVISPFVFSGAMSPASVAGTVIQLNAEVLAGIAFAQMLNPGTPCVYGAFQTNIDLQSGAPVFGSPEGQIALYVAAQLARRYGLPFRSGGMFASSKIPDAQAAYESVMAMMPAVLGGVNFTLHAAGWLEGGLVAGYEKFVMDVELLGMFHTFLKGLDLSENGLAMASLRNVAVDSHHLGTPHTMANFRTAFFRSSFFDYDSYEKWAEGGSETTYTKANKRYKAVLRSYKMPALDPAIDKALLAYMTKRKTEIKPEY